MGWRRGTAVLLSLAFLSSTCPARTDADRPFSPAEGAPIGHTRMTSTATWLEDIRGEAALNWVREQNVRTERHFASNAHFKKDYEAVLAVKQRSSIDGDVVSGRILSHEGWLYEVHTDSGHKRGVWRRVRINRLLAGKPEWENLVDVDALAKAERRAWVFQNQPAFHGNRALIVLSDGGGSRFSWREFDLLERRFVENGFVIPEGTGMWAVWKDENTLLVSDANRQTIKEWQRGTPFSEAKTLLDLDGDARGFGVSSYQDYAGKVAFLARRTDASVRTSIWRWGANGAWDPVSLPWFVQIVGFWRGQWIVRVKGADWNTQGRTWRDGSLLSIPDDELTRVPAPGNIQSILDANPRAPRNGLAITPDGLLVVTFENASDRISRYRFGDHGWTREAIPMPSDFGALTLEGHFVRHESFLHPPTLYYVESETDTARVIQQVPDQFSADCCLVEQLHALSKDGTRVPYLLVRSKKTGRRGDAPTILEGYGFYGAISRPHYDVALGKLWLERGGAYVLANVRGGGEFGPSWHVRGVERARTYEDIIAVAQDLIHRGITSPRRLGISGFSNGGLLAAVALNTRPELFGAGVISHAVLNQFEKHVPVDHPEYGSKNNPEELAFLEQTSPLQNLKRRKAFPPVLVLTATDDDSVAPYSSRKYAARLASLGLPYLYYESEEGAHGYGTTPEMQAKTYSMIYTFFAERLM